MVHFSTTLFVQKCWGSIWGTLWESWHYPICQQKRPWMTYVLVTALDNIFSIQKYWFFLIKTYVVDTHSNHLEKVIRMWIHNIWFYGEMRTLIISPYKHVVSTHWNCLEKVIPNSSHNIHFCDKIRKLFFFFFYCGTHCNCLRKASPAISHHVYLCGEIRKIVIWQPSDLPH